MCLILLSRGKTNRISYAKFKHIQNTEKKKIFNFASHVYNVPLSIIINQVIIVVLLCCGNVTFLYSSFRTNILAPKNCVFLLLPLNKYVLLLSTNFFFNHNATLACAKCIHGCCQLVSSISLNQNVNRGKNQQLYTESESNRMEKFCKI